MCLCVFSPYLINHTYNLLLLSCHYLITLGGMGGGMGGDNGDYENNEGSPRLSSLAPSFVPGGFSLARYITTPTHTLSTHNTTHLTNTFSEHTLSTTLLTTS